MINPQARRSLCKMKSVDSGGEFTVSPTAGGLGEKEKALQVHRLELE